MDKKKKLHVTCHICQKEFLFQRNLDVHIKEEHVHEKPCAECHRGYASQSFQPYMEALDEDQAVSCPVCSEAFRCKHKLKNHVRKHKRAKLFRCEACRESFNEERAFEDHMKSHVVENKCVCSFCQRGFRSQKNLIDHIEKEHIHEMPCPKCHKSFATKAIFWKHMETHYKQKMISCRVCHKTLWSDETLKNHMKTHAGENPFECETCGKDFIVKRLLEDHMEVHDGEKTFLCNVCQAAFLFERNLMKHVKDQHDGSDLCKISCVFSLSHLEAEGKPNKLSPVI